MMLGSRLTLLTYLQSSTDLVTRRSRLLLESVLLNALREDDEDLARCQIIVIILSHYCHIAVYRIVFTIGLSAAGPTGLLLQLFEMVGTDASGDIVGHQ